MIAELRRMANEAAQAAFHALIVKYSQTGTWDDALEARWLAAEKLVDLVDTTYQRMQELDPQAPDYFALLTADAGDHFAGMAS